VVPSVLSVNIGIARPIASKSGMSGIDKRPATAPVAIDVPADGGSGLAGDAVCDTTNHGGVDQAVYAYAREDLDLWQTDLGRAIPSGTFGENLTTIGLDVTDARIGERWRVGDACVLQVTSPRVPCRTFAVWLNEQGWAKTFSVRGIPGAYLRVISPGRVVAGDPITIDYRPDNDVTIGLTFRALTTEGHLLPQLLASPHLTAETERRARRRNPITLDS
jgi:MOSC domain-containing protein YiiM